MSSTTRPRFWNGASSTRWRGRKGNVRRAKRADQESNKSVQWDQAPRQQMARRNANFRSTQTSGTARSLRGIEIWRVKLKRLAMFSIAAMMLAAVVPAPAAQLSTDARGAIPRDVQQLVVIDYKAMQNSTAAMNLRNRVEPPELKQFDEIGR